MKKTQNKLKHRNEFRWNKKRKHYSYLYKHRGEYICNILITTKRFVVNKKNTIKYVNIHLIRHPNKNKKGDFYVIPRIYVDYKESFGDKSYPWSWDRNDKRKIKRIKKMKRK